MRPTTTDSKPATWYEATRVAFEARPSLDYVAEADVCIIGAGLAGLHVALEVARKGWSVVVLEAGTIATGASGRNAGFVHEGFAITPDRLEAMVGLSRAKALWKLSRDGLTAIRGLIETARLPGVGLELGGIHLSRRADPIAFRTEAERMTELYGSPGIFWSADRLRADVPSDLFTAGLYDSSAFHLHPLNYCLGVAGEALRAGAKIYERTAATAIDLRSIRRTVTTAKGAVRCDHVVIAGSALLAPLFPRVSSVIAPVTSYAAVTMPLGDRVREILPTRAALRERRRDAATCRIGGGDRLLWSSGAVAGIHGPERQRARIEREIATAFPKLAGVGLDYLWSAANGVTRNAMPQIGEIAPAVWVTTGYGHHGINTAAVAGLVVGRAIVEKNETFRLFEPFALKPGFGLVGLIRAQIDLWRDRKLDRASERADA